MSGGVGPLILRFFYLITENSLRASRSARNYKYSIKKPQPSFFALHDWTKYEPGIKTRHQWRVLAKNNPLFFIKLIDANFEMRWWAISPPPCTSASEKGRARARVNPGGAGDSTLQPRSVGRGVPPPPYNSQTNGRAARGGDRNVTHFRTIHLAIQKFDR